MSVCARHAARSGTSSKRKRAMADKATGPGAQIDTQIADLTTKVADLTDRVVALEEAGPVEPPTEPPVTEPPPSGVADIPLSWTDPRFNQTITPGRATLSKGQTSSNKSW